MDAAQELPTIGFEEHTTMWNATYNETIFKDLANGGELQGEDFCREKGLSHFDSLLLWDKAKTLANDVLHVKYLPPALQAYVPVIPTILGIGAVGAVGAIAVGGMYVYGHRKEHDRKMRKLEENRSEEKVKAGVYHLLRILWLDPHYKANLQHPHTLEANIQEEVMSMIKANTINEKEGSIVWDMLKQKVARDFWRDLHKRRPELKRNRPDSWYDNSDDEPFHMPAEEDYQRMANKRQKKDDKGSKGSGGRRDTPGSKTQGTLKASESIAPNAEPDTKGEDGQSLLKHGHGAEVTGATKRSSPCRPVVQQRPNAEVGEHLPLNDTFRRIANMDIDIQSVDIPTPLSADLAERVNPLNEALSGCTDLSPNHPRQPLAPEQPKRNGYGFDYDDFSPEELSPVKTNGYGFDYEDFSSSDGEDDLELISSPTASRKISIQRSSNKHIRSITFSSKKIRSKSGSKLGSNPPVTLNQKRLQRHMKYHARGTCLSPIAQSETALSSPRNSLRKEGSCSKTTSSSQAMAGRRTRAT